ncbi:hypothetical protein DXG01_012933 [Tephrocybe rancida]|nr:hypothetical protein DXG01_012933 [Tephrocybe rancida]
MLALTRATARRIPRATTPCASTRSFAEVVRAPSVSSSSPPSVYKPRKLFRILKERVPVREDHGLYGFFRKKEGAEELIGESKYEVVEDSLSKQKQTGESWKASELRLKSFKDLHTLWYILLRERNLLATQKEEARRLGVSDPSSQVSTNRVYHTRKSMARIKAVLNERRLAYEGAIKIVEEERDEKIDQEVQRSMEGAWQRKTEQAKRRRVYMARRLEMRLAKQAKRDSEKASLSATAPGESKPASPKPAPGPRRVGGLIVEG